jgi:phospholipid/cholesterol/gamma-HCH transport system ATP-binding protein
MSELPQFPPISPLPFTFEPFTETLTMDTMRVIQCDDGAREYVCEAKDLSFGWHRDEPILDGIELRVAPGAFLILTGESGHGKSTLLRLLAGLEKPWGDPAGKVFLFGEDLWEIRKRRLRELRRQAGYVFQNSALISNMTVEQNIAVPLRYHTDLSDADIRERARFWCDRLLLSGHETKRPALLSLGMQRRAAVARAMSMEPRLLFMDEPLAGLDARNVETMLSLIANLRALQDVAIVMVSHDLQPAHLLGGQVSLLLDGRLRPPRRLGDLLNSSDPRERDLVRSQAGLKET